MFSGKQKWFYKELRTPTTNEEYQEASNAFLDEMQTWIDSDKWKHVSEKDGTTLEAQDKDGSAIQITKCTKDFDDVSKFDAFVKKLFDSSPEGKKAIYEDMIDNQLLKEIDDNSHVAMSQFKAPVPLYPREFLALKSRRVLEDDSHLITCCSINFETVPFSKGFVRGTAISGMLVTPLYDENKIRVVKVDHIDPKGWVPGFVPNMLKAKSVSNINKMQGYL